MAKSMKPWVFPLRNWQTRAFTQYRTEANRNFLLVATPGAGKTMAAARIAHSMLLSNEVNHLIFVVPTEHLKRQVATAFSRVGIDLDPNWKNGDGSVASDYHGIVVTYQQVYFGRDILRAQCRRPTLLIADEIHHAGDQSGWGDAMLHAFEHAAYRLVMSGTPFRSDNKCIPFVEYVEDALGTKRSKADFVYGYADALQNNVCRPILFPSYEGRMEWANGLQNTVSATFADELTEEEARRRLRTALNPEGEWIRTVLRDANQRLTEIRSNGHPNAGGLILCGTAADARAVADVLKKQTGETATVALSEDENASREIQSFSDGVTKWIIAVRMVSEGVDIPRLRVGVYATPVISELFFRQVMGRFVRMITRPNGDPHPDEQSAYLYIPKDQTLVSYAQRVKDERDHELQEEIDRLEPNETIASGKQQSLYTFINAQATPDDVIFDHQALTQQEIEYARSLIEEGGNANILAEALARIIRLDRSKNGHAPSVSSMASTMIVPQSGRVPVDALHDRKQKLRKLLKRAVNVLVLASNGVWDYSAIYRQLISINGVQVKDATEEQLDASIKYVRRMIEECRRG